MKVISLLTLLFIGFSTIAQSNLTVFNNGGQAFYVILNGIKQNSKPETNVYVAGIKNGGYSVKIIFADGKTPDVDKNFVIDSPSDITTRIIFKKGVGKLQLVSLVPTAGPLQNAVVFRPTEAAVYSDAPVNVPVNSSINVQGNAAGVSNAASMSTTNNTTNTSTTTTTTTTQSDTPDNVNFNLNVNGTGVQMNVSGLGVNMNTNANTSVTGTSTTSTTNTNTSTNVVTSTTTSSSAPVSTTVTNQTTANQINSGQLNANQQNTTQNMTNSSANGHAIRCNQTLNRLPALIEELKDQSFEDDRVEALKLSLKTTCLYVNQAEQLIDLYSFDDNRLEVAKYLSDRLMDRENATALAKKLTFDSNKMEFRRYLTN
ncbi:MAG: hypothetical protein RLZZ301_1736 [Bacteroidota bacterium]|jgi:hypothetical protein